MTCCGVFQNGSSHFSSILAQKKAPPCEDVKNKTPPKKKKTQLSPVTSSGHVVDIFPWYGNFCQIKHILSSVPAQIILLTRFLSWQSFIVSHKRMDSNSSLEAFLTIAGSEAIRCYILLTRQMVLRRSLKGMKLKMCKITSSESSLNCAMN